MSLSILTPRLVLGAAALALASFSVAAPTAARAQDATISASSSEATTQVRQWDRKLRGQRVTELSRYNGGSSGGMTWRTDAYLCRDGRLFVDHESSVSIYVDGASGGSSGTKHYAGTWRIIWQGKWPAIETTVDGQRSLLNIGWDTNGRTYLNGDRVYVTDDAAARCQ